MDRKRQILMAWLAAAMLAAPASAAIHYQATTDTSGDGQKMQMVVEGWVDGGNAKVEFKDSDNPLMGDGTYLITKDGAKTLLLVNPKEKTYAVFDVSAMIGMAGAMMSSMGSMLKMEVVDPKVETVVDEDGGAVLGLPTRHLRFQHSYTLQVKVLGMSQVSEVEQVQDVWVTNAIRDPGLGAWLRTSPPKTGVESLDKLIAMQAGKIEGFPLKTEAVSTTRSDKGKAMTTRTTMVVTQLDADAAAPPASTFEVPAGYQATELLPMGEGNPFESLMKEKGRP